MLLLSRLKYIAAYVSEIKPDGGQTDEQKLVQMHLESKS